MKFNTLKMKKTLNDVTMISLAHFNTTISFISIKGFFMQDFAQLMNIFYKLMQFDKFINRKLLKLAQSEELSRLAC